MDLNDINLVTYDLYTTLSFRHGKPPKASALQKYFFNGALIVNNTFTTPISHGVTSYVKALESQIAIGNLKQFYQHEVHSETQIFNKVAQRTSVYEYSFAEIPPKKMPRGICYLQYVKEGDVWRITSMVWNDENEDHRIPAEWLG